MPRLSLQSVMALQAIAATAQEHSLAQQRAAGELVDFDHLIALHEPAIRRLAFRLLGWRGEVDDVVQDVFLAAFKRRSSFRGEANVSTWLAAITLNKCRSRRRWNLLRLRWLSRQASGDQRRPLDGESQREETCARVRQAIQQLSPRDREVIVLFHLELMPIAQIAEVLGTRNNVIQVRLHRARKRLKGTLSQLIEP